MNETVLRCRPSYEGANIRTWIGFKHFMYLVEEAVLRWLRDQGHGARELFHDYGLGMEIVDCSVQLPAVLEIDEEVCARVTAAGDGRLAVRLAVLRDGTETTVLRGRVTVALVREPAAPVHRPAPAPLAALEVSDLDEIGASAAAPPAPPAAQAAFRWSWRAPYHYCHFSDRVQHSGFVRALEDVVERFLADRGMSIRTMLERRGWIPVVSRASVRMLAAAHMEETVHTIFTVTDVLRRTMFAATMDCYVERGGARVPVATARILHGYAAAAGPAAGTPAELDDEVIDALLGRSRLAVPRRRARAPRAGRPRLYFALRSPYSWLAVGRLRAQVPDLFEAVDCVPFWQPDEPMGEALERRGGRLHYAEMGRAKRLYLLMDVKRLAEQDGLRVAWPVDEDPWWEPPHLAWLEARRAGRAAEFYDAVMEARWGRGEPIWDPGVLAAAARRAGLEPESVLGAVEDAGLREEAAGCLHQAYLDDVFGVPYMKLGRQRFCGVDRVPAFLSVWRPGVVPIAAGEVPPGTPERVAAYDAECAGACG